MKKYKSIVFIALVITVILSAGFTLNAYNKKQNELFAGNFYKPTNEVAKQIGKPAPSLPFSSTAKGYKYIPDLNTLKEMQRKGEIPFKPLLADVLGTPKYIKYRQQNSILYLVYFNKTIPPDKTFDDLINAGAVIIEEMPMEMSMKQAEDMFNGNVKSMEKIGGILHRTTINGFPATYGGNIGHEVHWYNGKVLTVICTNKSVSFPVLFKLAKSMH